MASSLFIDLNGEPIPDNVVLGYGRSGVVVYSDGLAIKTPLRHPWSSNADIQSNLEIIRHEQEVFRRFSLFKADEINGIVPCMGLYPNATHLASMRNGDLRVYLEKHNPPRTLQILCFRQMARALVQVHDKCVLVADIATRNCLLGDDLSVKICDFSEASILPLGTVMETADDDGFSIQTDIGQLGAVMYEVITSQRCQFDLFQDDLADDGRATWPQRTSLPRTDGLWLGTIIEKCWTEGGFQNAHCLLEALNSVEPERISDVVNFRATLSERS